MSRLDSAYFNNPDLPDTRSEIALPLRIGTDIFGALDVQSTETNAFSQEDLSMLSILADLVSVAIQNARSYSPNPGSAGTGRSLPPPKPASRTGGNSWQMKPVERILFRRRGHKKLQPLPTNSRPHSLAVPLILRGTHIGTIKLSATDPNRMWTDDEIDIAKAAAERTTIALENARLLQEAQKRAAKERAIGEISAKIGSLNDLESLLQTTIQELGNTLPDTDIAIQFQQKDQ